MGWVLMRRALCRSKDKYYLVFELAAGGELYDHLMEEGRFGEEEAREVAHALVVRLYPLRAAWSMC
jgi:hypothetical protein